jgi:hypothetical protein
LHPLESAAFSRRTPEAVFRIDDVKGSPHTLRRARARAMIAAISRPLAVISTIGWLLTLGLSVAGLAGALPPRLPDVLLEAFFFALLALYGGAIVALNLAMKNTPFTPPSWLRRAFDRAPQWAKFTFWGSVAYTIIAAAAGLILWGSVLATVGSGGLVVLSSFPVIVFSTTSISLDCPKGHVAGPFEQYCRTCGAPILENG